MSSLRSQAPGVLPRGAAQSCAERIVGTGELAERIRSLDWSRTTLGPIEGWPDALAILLNTILANRHPMLLFWGEELTQFYNDAAIPFLSPGKHPQTLGKGAREVWAEVWDYNGRQILGALSGEACWNEDQLVPILRDGRISDAWFTYSYSPVRDATGAIRGVLVTALETTGRMLAEHALRGERERLLRLIQQAPAFFAVLKGPEHVFDMVNPPYQRLIGGRDVLGRTVAEAVPEAVGQGYLAILDRVYQKGEPFIGENVRFVRSGDDEHDAEERSLDFVYQPLREPDGAVSGILVFGIDMTEHRRNESLLREQRERFEFATAAAGIGYWFCDLPFDKLAWDVRVKEHFWLPPDAEVDIDRFYAILHPEDRERTREAIETSIASHTPYDIEYRTVPEDGERDGRWKWIHAIGRTAYDSSGRPLRFDGVTLDVTALRGAQDARTRAEEALIRTEKLALVGRLAATISHEINNPLEAVTNLIYLIGVSAQDEESRRLANMAEKELARVSHIVRHTLRFNRRSNSAAEEKLADMLDSALAIYEARLRHAGIQVVRDYAAPGKTIGFAPELRQVFANLIANSFDAMKQGGVLRLRTRPRTNWKTSQPGVVVSIADTGMGIGTGTLPHLFEAFFTTKGENGTGLGLWVSREILTKHGATVRVRSRTTAGASGTIFSLWLPLPVAPSQPIPTSQFSTLA